MSETSQQPVATTAKPPQRLRVGWVAGRETIETLGRTLKPLAVGLLDELVELTVTCPEGADLRGLPTPPVEVFPHGRLGWFGLRESLLEPLSEQFKARKVNLLHALDAPAAALTRALSKMLNVPYVVSSYSVNDARKLGSLDSNLAALLAASEPVRLSLASHHVAPMSKLRLVRPGVYHQRRATCFLEPAQSVAIVAAGRLDHFTPFEAVIRSFAELRGRDCDCALFLIGNGRAESRLRALAEQLHVRQDVTFVDHQPTAQMPDVFKAADIFISPAAEPEIDAKALLAIAAGVPVLATDDRPSDFLIDGQTALLFTQGDAGELTDKLAGLLDKRAAARALAERALEYVEEHHSAADMVSAVIQIYRESLKLKAES